MGQYIFKGIRVWTVDSTVLCVRCKLTESFELFNIPFVCYSKQFCFVWTVDILNILYDIFYI